MKKFFGVLFILLLVISGISEVIFLDNGKILEGEITDINDGIAIVQVDDYKHMFSTSNISYIFFTKNYDFKNGIYLKNGIEIKKMLPLTNLIDNNFEFKNEKSRLILNKKDILQISFVDNQELTEINIEDSSITFEDIISKNNKEHIIKTSNGDIQIDLTNLKKFKNINKKYILNKNTDIYFLDDLTITKKGIKIFEGDDFYIKELNSLIRIGGEFDGGYNKSDALYSVQTKDKQYKGEIVFNDNSIYINKEEIKAENIVSINKNFTYKRDFDYFTSGYNNDDYFFLDEESNLFSLSKKGIIDYKKNIEDFNLGNHSIYSIKGNENYLFLRKDRELIILDAKTFEIKKRKSFSYIFSYNITDDYIIIFSSFNSEILIYDINDLTLVNEYNLDINVYDIQYWNDDLYLISSSFLYELIDGEYKIIEDFGKKITSMMVINKKLYLLSYDSVFIYDKKQVVEIELDAIYGYRHDGENLFVVTRDKIWAISDDKLYWEKGFANEAIRSSLIFINNHIYTIYGNNLYKFDKNGNFEIVYNYDFYKSSHNLYQLKDKYLLIADRKEIIQLIVAD